MRHLSSTLDFVEITGYSLREVTMIYEKGDKFYMYPYGIIVILRYDKFNKFYYVLRSCTKISRHIHETEFNGTKIIPYNKLFTLIYWEYK